MRKNIGNIEKVITCLLALTCSLEFCVADDKEYLDKAIAGWRKIERATRTSSAEEFIETGGRKGASCQWAFKGDNALTKRGSTVKLRNGERAYILKKNPKDEWQLVNLTDEQGNELIDIGYRRLQAFSFTNVSLIDAAEDRFFELSDWKTLENGTLEFRLEYFRDKAEAELSEPKRVLFDREMFFQVDPNENYRVVGYRFDHPSDTEGRGRVDGVYHVTGEHQYELDEFLPSKVINKSIKEGRDPYVSATVLTSISHVPLPSEEFTLAYYGLEDVFAPRDSWKKWVAIFLGIAAIAIGVFLIRRHYPK